MFSIHLQRHLQRLSPGMPQVQQTCGCTAASSGKDTIMWFEQSRTQCAATAMLCQVLMRGTRCLK